VIYILFLLGKNTTTNFRQVYHNENFAYYNSDMGNTQCGGEGRPCHYYIFPNATPGSAQDKQNRLLNYLVGLNSQQDLLNNISGQTGPGIPWSLAYPLIFPPAIQTVYSLNAALTNRSSGQIDPNNPNQCTQIANPYYEHSLILQNAMAGYPTTNMSMPCSKTYNVPFAINNDVQHLGEVIFQEVPNIPGPNGGGYDACWSIMEKQLETPQSVGGQLLCVGDQGYPTIDGDTSYSYNWIIGNNFIGYAAGVNNPPPLLQAFLQDPSNPNNLKALFPPQTSFGPYDTSTQQPCSNINTPTCTYYICKNQSQPAGYLCGVGGKCNPTYQTIPPPPFKTLADCVACQANGNCGGTNICCPQSQSGGTCPSTPPPPTPPSTSFVIEAAVGIAIFIILIILLIFAIRTINKHLKS
jgi:hypothetical protein